MNSNFLRPTLILCHGNIVNAIAKILYVVLTIASCVEEETEIES